MIVLAKVVLLLVLFSCIIALMTPTVQNDVMVRWVLILAGLCSGVLLAAIDEREKARRIPD